MVDVTIVGGGIVGCSLLYRLSLYDVKAILVEKENDVALGATKANSAIVHAGYDPEPGTLMARYNVAGNRMIHALAAALDVPLKSTGSLVLAFGPEQDETVRGLYERGLQNGVPGLKLVGQEELRQMEPNVSPEATSALHAPTGAVVSPWELAIAQAETAIQNGAEVWLDAPVQRIDRPAAGGFILHTAKGPIQSRFVVNTAGLGAEGIDAMVGLHDFTTQPNRGQYFLLDKTQGGLANHVLFQCPTAVGKGVLVAPTVHGNLIVGPDSAPVLGNDTCTTFEGLAAVREAATKSVPGISFGANIRHFAGVRAITEHEDFLVGPVASVPGWLRAAGIKSPGLTAAPAIAEDLTHMLGEQGLSLTPKEEPITTRTVTRFNHLSPEEKAALIEKQPAYGSIVCRCELVTEGDILAALAAPLPPRSLDGVKRRCGSGMGRCQGGFCGPKVQELISRTLSIPREEVPQDRAGMPIVTGRTKTQKNTKK